MFLESLREMADLTHELETLDTISLVKNGKVQDAEHTAIPSLRNVCNDLFWNLIKETDQTNMVPKRIKGRVLTCTRLVKQIMGLITCNIELVYCLESTWKSAIKVFD